MTMGLVKQRHVPVVLVAATAAVAILCGLCTANADATPCVSYNAVKASAYWTQLNVSACIESSTSHTYNVWVDGNTESNFVVPYCDARISVFINGKKLGGYTAPPGIGANCNVTAAETINNVRSGSLIEVFGNSEAEYTNPGPPLSYIWWHSWEMADTSGNSTSGVATAYAAYWTP